MEGVFDRKGGWGNGKPSAPVPSPTLLVRGVRAGVVERETMRMDSTLPFRAINPGRGSGFPG